MLSGSRRFFAGHLRRGVFFGGFERGANLSARVELVDGLLVFVRSHMGFAKLLAGFPGVLHFGLGGADLVVSNDPKPAGPDRLKQQNATDDFVLKGAEL